MSVRTKVVAVIVILCTATVGAITVGFYVNRSFAWLPDRCDSVAATTNPELATQPSTPLVRCSDFHTHRYFAWKGWLAWVSPITLVAVVAIAITLVALSRPPVPPERSTGGSPGAG